MKFSGTQFTFGKAEVFINSIDTDKAMISGSIKLPVGNGNVWIRLHRAKTWAEAIKMSLEVEWIENDPPKPEEKDEYDIMLSEEGEDEDTDRTDDE